MAELPEGHDDLRDGLRAIRLIGVQFGASDPEARATLEAVRRGPRGSGPGARALTAMTALAVALGDGTAAEASALAREAFAGEGMAGFEVTAPVALATAVLTLGEPGEGLRAVDAYRAPRPPTGRDPRLDRRRALGRLRAAAGRRPARGDRGARPRATRASSCGERSSTR